MRPEERDPAYLWDMLQAARQIHAFAAGVSASAYLADRKLQLAVERCLEIVGEAARCVSQEFRESHPEIPWARIIAQRNVLVHEYGEIRQELVWKVATERIPELLSDLERLLPPSPPDEGSV